MPVASENLDQPTERCRPNHRLSTKQATISRLESGAEIPTLERLARLLTVMGFRLDTALAPLDHDLDEDDLAVARARTPEERLREAMSWNRFATQLDAAVSRADQS